MVQDDSAIGRIHFWKVAFEMAKDNPLGIGLWGFESAYDKYDSSGGRFGQKRSVHNSYLEVLTEAGWMGALASAEWP